MEASEVAEVAAGKWYTNRMSKDKVLREQVIRSLNGDAHMSFAEAVKDFPAKHYNTFPPHVDYTFWHVLEHIRITQWDILDYATNPKYQELFEWPKDYWPTKNAKATKKEWDKTIAGIEKDLKAMKKLVENLETDLHTKIPWGKAPIVREVLLVIDHNAYHLGEFAILRQVVGAWPKNHK